MFSIFTLIIKQTNQEKKRPHVLSFSWECNKISVSGLSTFLAKHKKNTTQLDSCWLNSLLKSCFATVASARARERSVVSCPRNPKTSKSVSRYGRAVSWPEVTSIPSPKWPYLIRPRWPGSRNLRTDRTGMRWVFKWSVYHFKGVLPPRPILWLHFSKKLQHIGDK